MQDVNDLERSPQAGGGAILSVSLSTTAFGATFGHCGQLVDYLAKYVSIHHEDVERSARMFSTVLNEALEAIARHHAQRGALALELRRSPGAVELGARIPVDPSHLGFYAEAAKLAARADLKDWYLAQIRAGASDLDPALLGLAELVATFRASLRVEDAPRDGAISLTVVFPLAEMEES